MPPNLSTLDRPHGEWHCHTYTVFRMIVECISLNGCIDPIRRVEPNSTIVIAIQCAMTITPIHETKKKQTNINIELESVSSRPNTVWRQKYVFLHQQNSNLNDSGRVFRSDVFILDTIIHAGFVKRCIFAVFIFNNRFENNN